MVNRCARVEKQHHIFLIIQTGLKHTVYIIEKDWLSTTHLFFFPFFFFFSFFLDFPWIPFELWKAETIATQEKPSIFVFVTDNAPNIFIATIFFITMYLHFSICPWNWSLENFATSYFV